MKSLNSALLLSMVLILAISTSCVQAGEDTKIPSLPASITVTSTKVPTALPTDTPTFISTLPIEQAQANLLELLSNNASCRLPCFLGITPGKTTYTEARNILYPFSSISISMNLSGDNNADSAWLTYDEGDIRTFAELSYFYNNKGTVNSLMFKAGEYKETAESRSPVYNSKIFGNRLHLYMLSGILSEFGKPTSVVIHTSGEQITGSGGFDILLLYPNEGIFAHYTTQMETTGTNARGCPANAQVELHLSPSGNIEAFTKSLSETTLGGMFEGLEIFDNPSWKSIEKVTTMSLDQFHETFYLPTDKCIETPLKEWYVPDN
ncbi:MAG TPA: hypothetical protein PLT08_05200 [Anaerolineales bacterium]|nr:hypothetical protein [Anaerolineales bacterium]